MMLAGKFKLSPKEKERRAQVMSAMQPDVCLEFIHDDYHEDEETPFGFFERGDVVKLLSIVKKQPIIRSDAKEVIHTIDVWLLETRYGTIEKDSIYLAAMTKVKSNETES